MGQQFLYKGQFKGTSVQTGTIKSGDKAGQQWTKTTLLVQDMSDEWAKSPIGFDTFNDKVAGSINNLVLNTDVEVSFEMKGNEWNGKNYVNLNVIMVNDMGIQRGVAPEPKKKMEPMPSFDTGEDDPLPF